MKHILITIIAVLLVGCGESQQSAPAPESKPVEPIAEATKPEPQITKAPDISIQGTSKPEADQALFEAVWEENIKSIKQALNDGAKADARNVDFWTPLIAAAADSQDKSEIAELLIAKGADVNSKDAFGWTPLHESANSGNKEITELLISKGAEVNAKRKDGTTPLDWAAMSGRNQTFLLVRNHGGQFGTIHGPAVVGDIKSLKEFISAGADVNSKTLDGDTPLDLAMSMDKEEIAKLLLANGADVNAKNTVGWTPLHEAADRGQMEIAEILIDKGADLNAMDDDDRTPLDVTGFSLIDTLLRKHGGKTGEEFKAAGN